MPLKLFSQTERVRRGWIRRVLKTLGDSWLACPLRRCIQALCLILFLGAFLYTCWPYDARPSPMQTITIAATGKAAPAHYFISLEAKSFLPPEIFLALDPLVSLSTSLAGRTWVWSLLWAGGLLVVCLIVPRGFCGYLCPLGTLIDIFDWSVGKRVKHFRVTGEGWWVHLRYYLLLGVLVTSLCGVLMAGFVAAIPVLTRGLQFILAPVQMSLQHGGWRTVPPLNAGHWFSIALFFGVFGLGFLRPRFWCRHVCPTGAVFSVMNRFRLSERKVESTCIACYKCIDICPFDAIKADFTTRPDACTLCQTCGGACPTAAIQFVSRWQPVAAIVTPEKDKPTTSEVALSRRGFISAAGFAVVVSVGISQLGRAGNASTSAALPIRPPGSVPEKLFLELCIRCGECFKVCPNNVLQPQSFSAQGLNGLWAPTVVANWSGCEPSCANCGQVCPTGAIRPLPLEEKRAARMGLAVIDKETCLPWAEREACQMCVDECVAAGYDAIEFVRVGTEVDDDGMPIVGSGFLAPNMLPAQCVGCGLCQTRCHYINVKQKKLLAEPAILVSTGVGREDRMQTGSYLARREAERQARDRRELFEERRLLREQGISDSYFDTE